ncbi:kinase/pyrophosphorylase [Abyssogena phaseoliformis symbiont]|uniref:kinase/pyrophosphorylase n=1 Tax=Abyssogena phaseoliformis symbiont TaxID=596095 RepID=UPI0024799286|nr:kinase/pyrophosphorylase [Abyssogena phaseoliformis symbiont]
MHKNYATTDVILIGVSRSGKTTACLLLVLQYGIYATNYPLIEQDLHTECLPESLQACRHKIVWVND